MPCGRSSCRNKYIKNFKSANVDMKERMSVGRHMEGKKIYASYLKQQVALKEKELGLAK